MTASPLWAAGFAAGYFLLCLRLGERFPFSKYSMYAVTARRKAGAVPVFLADGRPAPIERYTAFSGIDPERISPPPSTCSLEWRVHELRRWLSSHRSEPGAAPGPVSVAVGYRLLALGPDGRLAERLKLVARGSAWPRG